MVSDVFCVSKVFPTRTRCRAISARGGTRRTSANVRGMLHRSQRSQGRTWSSLASIGWPSVVTDVSMRRAGLAAYGAQTTERATHRIVRARLPPREVGAPPGSRRERRWSSGFRRSSCVASLTDEWSTETEHNIALANQVKSPASIAGEAPQEFRALATFRDCLA